MIDLARSPYDGNGLPIIPRGPCMCVCAFAGGVSMLEDQMAACAWPCSRCPHTEAHTLARSAVQRVRSASQMTSALSSAAAADMLSRSRECVSCIQ